MPYLLQPTLLFWWVINILVQNWLYNTFEGSARVLVFTAKTAQSASPMNTLACPPLVHTTVTSRMSATYTDCLWIQPPARPPPSADISTVIFCTSALPGHIISVVWGGRYCYYVRWTRIGALKSSLPILQHHTQFWRADWAVEPARVFVRSDPSSYSHESRPSWRDFSSGSGLG